MSARSEQSSHTLFSFSAVLSRCLPGFFSDEAQWNTFKATAGYSARVFLCIGIAVFLAFMFQLHSPLSAATTVLIVANPTVGAMVSKSVWRVIGTVIGAVISIGIMAVFVQSPVLYFAALSVFVGIACMVATFLRFFRAYAAVLTGYTIVIIAAPAFADPDNIFLSAMGRLSAVVTGVVVTACVFMVTSPRKPSAVLEKLGNAFRDTILHAKNFHAQEGLSSAPEEHAAEENNPSEITDTTTTGTAFRSLPQPLYDSRSRLLAGMAGLTPAIEFAAADDPDMQARISNLRLTLNRLTGLIVSYHPYWLNLSLVDAQSRPVHQYVAEALEQILHLTEQPGWLENPTPVSACLHDCLKNLEQLSRNNPAPSLLATLDNTRDILVQIDLALYDLTSLRRDRESSYTRQYLEWPVALRNGVRGMFIALLAGMLWYVFHWSAGPMLILYVVAASSLLSTAPSAGKASPMMATGTMLAVPMGFLCHSLFLPRIDGYPLLWLTLCLFLLPGVWLQFHPRYSIGAFGYAVFFTMLLSINNPIIYNDLALTNNWLTMVAACVLLVLVFRVILPPDHRLDAARLVSSLTRSLQQLALSHSRKPVQWIAWEGLQLQKITRLMMRLSFIPSGIDRQGYTDAAFATLSLGRLILRLRWNAEHVQLNAQARTALESALKAFSMLRHAPLSTAEALEQAAAVIHATTTDQEGANLMRGRTISCLMQAAGIIRAIPGFYDKYGPIHRSVDEVGATAPVSTLVSAGSAG
ncbi:FUSC family protein [Acetobacter pasteurianus]|uniref:FUSC family protein n=1 Tax=Acetobacter pasteurianus TaxID=438 RepID=UPI0002F33279|nr:FUSC family protein [Acetobacter pasteurianus]GCD50531.1 fusaric acid resistance protein FusB [Acetobacter pasteurianus subsp. pasteurianus LMG 1262 = NBRC 106471]